jgi:cytochrome b involved in lipid metabolism
MQPLALTSRMETSQPTTRNDGKLETSVNVQTALSSKGSQKWLELSSVKSDSASDVSQADSFRTALQEDPAPVTISKTIEAHPVESREEPALPTKSGLAKEQENLANAKLNEPLKLYTLRQISVHNSTTDMWLVIDNEVYNVTDFQHQHPGGAKSELICYVL